MSKQKMDLTVTKSSVISISDFSMIKPEVSFTLRDVDREDFDQEYKRLSEAAEAALAYEIARQTNEHTEVTKIGARKFAENVDLEKIESKLSEFTKIYEID